MKVLCVPENVRLKLYPSFPCFPLPCIYESLGSKLHSQIDFYLVIIILGEVEHAVCVSDLS